MAMLPISEEVKAQRQAEDLKLLPASGAVEYVNSDALGLLSTVREVEFPEGSGIWYSVPRVPYYEGTQIRDLHSRIMDARKFPDQVSVGIFDKLLDQICDIAWNKLIVPKGRWMRFRKWAGLMQNPLRKNMSEAEVAALISFFLARRMTSSVSFRYPARSQETSSRRAST